MALSTITVSSTKSMVFRTLLLGKLFTKKQKVQWA